MHNNCRFAPQFFIFLFIFSASLARIVLVAVCRLANGLALFSGELLSLLLLATLDRWRLKGLLFEVGDSL